MQQRYVTTVAMLVCAVIIAGVGGFSFIEYRAARAREAAFRMQMLEAARAAYAASHAPKPTPRPFTP